MDITKELFDKMESQYKVSGMTQGVGSDGRIVGYLDSPSDWVVGAPINFTTVLEVMSEDGCYCECTDSVLTSNGSEFLLVKEKKPTYFLRK